MSNCTKPTEPSPSAPWQEHVQYARDLVAYAECIREKDSGTGCAALKLYRDSIGTLQTLLTAAWSPPTPPLSDTPSSDFNTQVGQHDAKLAIAGAQDITVQAEWETAWLQVDWCSRWAGPPATTNTLQNIAGC